MVAALALAVWLVRMSDRVTISSGGGISPAIAEPAFTPADIDRIARGEPADAARPDQAVLTRAILGAAWVYGPEYPGSPAVDVGFVPAPGQRRDVWSIGWPAPWLTRVREPNYEDAARREGLKATVSDPKAAPTPKWESPRDPLNLPVRARWEWYSRVLHYQPPPEQTGGVTTTWQIGVFAPVLLVGAVVLAWYACGLFVWVIDRFRARERHRRRRRVQVIAAAAVALALVLASVLTAGQEATRVYTFPKLTQVGVPPTPVIWTREGFARLPFTRAELERLADDPSADARVAAAIRDLAFPGPDPGAAGPVYLAAATDCETQYAYDGAHNCTGWTLTPGLPLLLVHRLFYVRRPDFGTPEIVAPPSGVRLSSYHGRVGVVIATGDAAKPVYRALVEPTIFGSVIVCLWLIFWTTRLVTIVRSRAVRARRLRRECCPACAYPLPPGAPSPAT